MIAPSRGHASVLGLVTRAISPSLLSQVGYVSESQALPGRLRVDQFFDYLRPCYPNKDSQLKLQLRQQLRKPPKQQNKTQTHDKHQKQALACAMSFRPKLLVLD